jgi:hypothetical protein
MHQADSFFLADLVGDASATATDPAIVGMDLRAPIATRRW